MERIVFDNGFRILLDPLPWLKSCSMGVWVGSGSRFETPETSGISHFIEHMLFKGTTNLSARDIAVMTDETGGSLNAYTAKEYTCFYARSLTAHIEKIFSLIGEMITSPLLKKDDIELEKGVVLEELSSYEDSSEDLCMDTFYECFWKDDMLGKNIVGRKETVLSFDEKAIRDHMSRFYVPERTVAVFSGNFDKDHVISLCRKYFGDAKNTDSPITFSDAQSHRFIKRINKHFEQNIITLGFPGISSLDKNLHACNFACAMLGGTGSSRLFQRLREEFGLVYSVDSFNTAYLGTGSVCITMGLSRQNEEKALCEILKTVKDFPDTVTEDEFRRIKEQTEAAVIMSLESPGTRASRLGRSELLSGEAISEDQLLCDLNSVSFDDVRNVSKTVFDLAKISLCVVGKTNSQKYYRDILSR